MATVDKIRDKMIRWRKFTRTTLVVEDSKDTAKDFIIKEKKLGDFKRIMPAETPDKVDQEEPMSPIKKVMFSEEPTAKTEQKAVVKTK
jgi:hypothetical protein